jgi:probable rRNA maturation factor
MASLTLYLEDLFFLFDQEISPISNKDWQNWFQIWFELVAKYPIKEYEISLRLTDNEEIKMLNNRFREKNEATDVLSFPSLFNEFINEPIYLGDIIISVETAKRQAKEKQHSLIIELAWLASHGFLHLLGWDHPDDQTLTKMLKQQEILLRNVNFL